MNSIIQKDRYPFFWFFFFFFLLRDPIVGHNNIFIL